MKTKYTSMFGLLVIALLVASFVLPQSFIKPSAVAADPGVMRWTSVDTPGRLPPSGDITNLGGFLGSAIHDFAVGPDSLTLLASLWDNANPSVFPPEPSTMLRCAPFMGIGWPFSCYTALERAPDWGPNSDVNTVAAPMGNRQIYFIAIAPDDAKFWAVITDGGEEGDFPTNTGLGPQEVWVTRNGGARWEMTSIYPELANPIDNPGVPRFIRAIDISIDYGGRRDIALATVDGADTADIYVVKSTGFGGWEDQNMVGTILPPGVGADFFAVKFSPTYSGDSSLAFVFANANGTFYNIAFRDIDTNVTLGLAFANADGGIEVRDPTWAISSSPTSAQLNEVGLELPSDFSGTAVSLRRAYISTDALVFIPCEEGAANPNPFPGKGGAKDGIFRMDDTTVYTLMDTSQDMTKSIYSIAYFGTYASGKLLAGERMGYPCTATVPTWFTDSPTTCPIPCWYPALKPTTGGINPCCEEGELGNCGIGGKNGPGGAIVAWNPAGTLAYVVTGPDLIVSGIEFFWQWVSYQPLSAINAFMPAYTTRFPIPNLEGAFAISRNNGETWNQLGMINTTIDWLNDVAAAPDCSTVYIASVNRFNCLCGDNVTAEAPGTGCTQFDSVWRSSQNPAVVSPLVPATPIGMYWERVFTHTTSLDCMHCQTDLPILRLPPYCDDLPDGQLIAWAARGTRAMAWSPDYGDYWAMITPRNTVQDFAFESSKVMYVLASDRSDVLIAENVTCSDDCVVGGISLVQKLPFTGTAWSTLLPSVDAGLSGTHTISAYPEGQVLVTADSATNLAMAASFCPNFNTDTPAFASLWMIQSGALGDHGDVHGTFDQNFKTNGIIYVADEFTAAGDTDCCCIQGSSGSVYRNTYPAPKRWVEMDMMDPSNGACIPPYESEVGFFGIVNAFTGASTGSQGEPSSQTALYAASGVPECCNTCETDEVECPPGTFIDCSEQNSAVFRTLWPQDGMPKPGIVWDALETFTPTNTTGVWFTLEPSSLKECGSCSVDTNTTLYAIDDESWGAFMNPSGQSPIVCGSCAEKGYDPLISQQGMLWTYTDCLAKKGPALVTEDKTLIGCDPVSGRASEVNLCWEQLCVATGYDIEIAKNDDFSIKVIDWAETCQYGGFFDPERTSIPCAFIPAGGTITFDHTSDVAVTLSGFIECGHTYYWRVQVRESATGEIARSPWSETRTFTVKAGLPVTATSTGAQLLAPNNGGMGIPVKNVSFSWSPFGDTSKWKFQLAKDPAMTQIVKEDTVSTTAYAFAGPLDNSTSYFWRVQPLEPFPGDWSAVYSFQTEAPPAPPAGPAKAPATPVWVWAVIAIGAILVIVVLVLIFKTRRT